MGKATPFVLTVLSVGQVLAGDVAGGGETDHPTTTLPPPPPPDPTPSGIPDLSALVSILSNGPQAFTGALPPLPRAELFSLVNAMTPTHMPLLPAMVGGLGEHHLPDIDRLMAFLPEINGIPTLDIPQIENIYAKIHGATALALAPIEGKMNAKQITLLDGAFDQVNALAMQEILSSLDLNNFDGVLPEMPFFKLPSLYPVPVLSLTGATTPRIFVDLIPDPIGLGLPLEAPAFPALHDMKALFPDPIALSGSVLSDTFVLTELASSELPSFGDLDRTFAQLKALPGLKLSSKLAGLESNIVSLRHFMAPTASQPLAGLNVTLPPMPELTPSLPSPIIPTVQLSTFPLFDSPGVFDVKQLIPSAGFDGVSGATELFQKVHADVAGALATAFGGAMHVEVLDSAVNEVTAMVMQNIPSQLGKRDAKLWIQGIVDDVPLSLPELAVIPLGQEKLATVVDLVALPAIPSPKMMEFVQSTLKLKGALVGGKLQLKAIPKQLKLQKLNDTFSALSTLPGIALGTASGSVVDNALMLRPLFGNTGDQNYILRSLSGSQHETQPTEPSLSDGTVMSLPSDVTEVPLQDDVVPPTSGDVTELPLPDDVVPPTSGDVTELPLPGSVVASSLPPVDGVAVPSLPLPVAHLDLPNLPGIISFDDLLALPKPTIELLGGIGNLEQLLPSVPVAAIPNIEDLHDDVYASAVSALQSVLPAEGDVRVFHGAYEEITALMVGKLVEKIDLEKFSGVLPDIPTFELPAFKVVPSIVHDGAPLSAVVDLIALPALPQLPTFDISELLGNVIHLKGSVKAGKIGLVAAPKMLKFEGLRQSFLKMQSAGLFKGLDDPASNVAATIEHLRQMLGNSGDASYITAIVGDAAEAGANLREPSSRRLDGLSSLWQRLF